MTTPRVTVPVDDWKHVIGALKNAQARLGPGAAVCNVSAVLAKVELLSAAPAPEGGAVRDVQGLVRPDAMAGRRWRHKVRGTTYTSLGFGKAQCSPSGLLDDENVVIYRGDDGSLWARRHAEFSDGRFEELPAIATREEAPAEAGEIGAEYDAAAHCVTLAECPPGLFLWNGTLGFKSEYGAMEPDDATNGKHWKAGNRADAYCADSGEYFWGGTSNHDDRAKLIVYPIAAETVAMVASHGSSALRAHPPAREDAQPVGWPENDPVYVSALRVLKGTTGWDQRARDLTARLIAKNTHPVPDALRVAVEALVNKFAWSAVTADCEEARIELQRRIDAVRAALQAEQKAGA